MLLLRLLLLLPPPPPPPPQGEPQPSCATGGPNLASEPRSLTAPAGAGAARAVAQPIKVPARADLQPLVASMQTRCPVQSGATGGGGANFKRASAPPGCQAALQRGGGGTDGREGGSAPRAPLQPEGKVSWPPSLAASGEGVRPFDPPLPPVPAFPLPRELPATGRGSFHASGSAAWGVCLPEIRS